MITKASKELLDKMQDLEYEKFVLNKPGTLGTLAKQERIRRCFKEIYSSILSRKNSMFTIINSDSTLSVNMYNVETDNDHISMYLITLHENCETYQLDRVISNERSSKQTIKQFESKERDDIDE